jgi:carbon storage regulator
MLCLSRRKHETLVLTVAGIEIVVAVGEIRGDVVRLGVQAPSEVKVLRGELAEQERERGAA